MGNGLVATIIIVTGLLIFIGISEVVASHAMEESTCPAEKSLQHWTFIDGLVKVYLWTVFSILFLLHHHAVAHAGTRHHNRGTDFSTFVALVVVLTLSLLFCIVWSLLGIYNFDINCATTVQTPAVYGLVLAAIITNLVTLVTDATVFVALLRERRRRYTVLDDAAEEL